MGGKGETEARKGGRERDRERERDIERQRERERERGLTVWRYTRYVRRYGEALRQPGPLINFSVLVRLSEISIFFAGNKCNKVFRA